MTLEQVAAVLRSIKAGFEASRQECQELMQRIEARYRQADEALELINGMLTDERDGADWWKGIEDDDVQLP